MKNTISTVALCLLLSACGTTSQLSMADREARIPAGQSRLIFERTHAYTYAASDAEVTLDGLEVADIGLGGQALKDVKAGKHLLSVTTTGACGHFDLPVETKAGKTYTYEVAVNASIGKMVGGVFYDVLTCSTNGGYFKLTPKGE